MGVLIWKIEKLNDFQFSCKKLIFWLDAERDGLHNESAEKYQNHVFQTVKNLKFWTKKIRNVYYMCELRNNKPYMIGYKIEIRKLKAEYVWNKRVNF